MNTKHKIFKPGWARKPCFADLVVGHKFVAIAKCKLPRGRFIWCDSCGGRLTFYVLLYREDGKLYRFGKTCLYRLGLHKAGEGDEPKKGMIMPIFVQDDACKNMFKNEGEHDDKARNVLKQWRDKEKQAWSTQADPEGFVHPNRLALL